MQKKVRRGSIIARASPFDFAQGDASLKEKNFLTRQIFYGFGVN